MNIAPGDTGASVCGSCLQPMPGGGGTSVCLWCQRPILASQFSIQDGQLYHVHCHPSLRQSTSPPHPSITATRGTLLASSISQRADCLGTDVCYGCSRLIRDDITTAAMGKTWHRDCFRCGKCARPIRENKFRSDGPTPLHINCKLADSVRICVGCYRPITDLDVTEAMGELWHPDCFRCAICSLRIYGSDFVRKGLQPAHIHCRRPTGDHVLLSALSSPECGVPLTRSHLVNGIAVTPLGRDRQGMDPDPHPLGGTLPSCHRCRAPIVGQGRQALGYLFHPACFLCGDCGLPVAMGVDCLLGSQPYHKRCVDALTKVSPTGQAIREEP